MKKILLSIDSECLDHPEYLNLKRDDLNNSDWLTVFTDANLMRKYINETNENFELWIISSDDIEAINLAAACKKDRKDCVVCLVSYDLTGSLRSRVEAAKIDSLLNIPSFNERFFALKQGYENKLNIKNNKLSDSKKIKITDIPASSSYEGVKNKAFVLSVLSASGGAGKSSVSAMSGVLAQASGFKTLIIDADLQFGEIATLLGVQDPLLIDNLISNNSLIGQLQPKNNLPCVLAPPSMPELAEKVMEQFPQVLENLRSIFDVIVVNTGSYWNEQHAILLERDSKSLFLVDQRPSSISATKTAMDLCDRCGIATGSVYFALNKCGKNCLFSSVDVSYALNGAPVGEIMDGGIDVDEALSSGSPLSLIKDKNSFAVSLWTILENFLPKNSTQNFLAKTKTRGRVKGKKKKSRILRRA